jgi:hypothetical protein
MKRLAVVLVLILALVAPVAAQQHATRPAIANIGPGQNKALTVQCMSGGENVFSIMAKRLTLDPDIPGWIQIHSGGVWGLSSGIIRTNLKCTYIRTDSLYTDQWKFGYPGVKKIQCWSGADLEWADDARAIVADRIPGYVIVRNGPIDAPVPGAVHTNLACIFIQK